MFYFLIIRKNLNSIIKAIKLICNIFSLQKTDQFLEKITKVEHGRYPSVSTILGCTTSQRLLYHWQLKMIEQLGGMGAFRKYMRG